MFSLYYETVLIIVAWEGIARDDKTFVCLYLLVIIIMFSVLKSWLVDDEKVLP